MLSTLAFIVFAFDPIRVPQDRPGPDADRLLIARLAGIALRHAKWGGLDDDAKAAGAAELREVAGGRADLLAETGAAGPGSRQASELTSPAPDSCCLIPGPCLPVP